MVEISKTTKRYPTDLTHEEWERVRPFLPVVAGRGRRPKTDLLEVLNAIRYMARSKVAAPTLNALWNVIGRTIDTLPPRECANYF
jgi:transposase